MYLHVIYKVFDKDWKKQGGPINEWKFQTTLNQLYLLSFKMYPLLSLFYLDLVSKFVTERY